MANKITKYVIDACALIAFLQDETGGDKLNAIDLSKSNTPILAPRQSLDTR